MFRNDVILLPLTILSLTGTCNWREFGEGGLLWAECNGRHFEWLQGDMLNEILFKVRYTSNTCIS